MDKAKSITKRNQPENRTRGKKYGAGVAPSRTYALPKGIDLWGFLIRMTKHLPWGWGYINPIQRLQKYMKQRSKR